MAWKLPRMCGLALAPALGAALALNGCGGGSSESLKALSLREVKLPDGQIIKAETALGPEEMQRGLMFRESLAPDRGMLFVHNAEGQYPYWMYHCKISLDMIWMDPAADRGDRGAGASVPAGPPGTVPELWRARAGDVRAGAGGGPGGAAWAEEWASD